MVKQEQQVKDEIAVLITKQEQIKKTVDMMATIPCIGSLTAAIVLAETNGFELISNKRQLSSYAGLDIREKQPGTSIKRQSTYIKKGK